MGEWYDTESNTVVTSRPEEGVQIVAGSSPTADEQSRLDAYNSAGTGGSPKAVEVTGAPSDGDSLVWNASAGRWEPGAGSGGSSAAGAAIIRAFPFTFDTPDLVTGHEIFTPTVGDVLLDAWIEVKTAWNGTTPKADVGPYTSSANGIFYAQIDAVDLRYVDWAYPAGGINADPLTAQNANVSSSLSTQFLDLAVSNAIAAGSGIPKFPRWQARFISDDPWKIVVSSDGSRVGADPGATQGAAVLYLVTATPVTAS